MDVAKLVAVLIAVVLGASALRYEVASGEQDATPHYAFVTLVVFPIICLAMAVVRSDYQKRQSRGWTRLEVWRLVIGSLAVVMALPSMLITAAEWAKVLLQ